MNSENVQATGSPFSTASNISFEVDPAIVSFRYFGISVAIFAIFVGTIGNFMTILAYFANTKLQTTFNMLVVNLSVVDMISASLMLPFNLAGYVQMQWPFGNDSFTARLQFFVYFSCGYTSVVFLVTITINRLIGVFWPTSYDALFKKRKMGFILFFCWTFGPILLLPFLLGTDPSCDNVNQALTGFHRSQFLCTFICLPKIGWDPYMQLLACTQYILFIVTTGLYFIAHIWTTSCLDLVSEISSHFRISFIIQRFTRILFQFLPLAIMIVSYLAIFFQLRSRAQMMERNMTRGLRSFSDASSTAVISVAGRSAVLVNQKSTQSNLSRKALSTKRKYSMAEVSLTRPTLYFLSLVTRLFSQRNQLFKRRRNQNNNRMLLISVVICVAFMVTFLPSVIINILPGRKQFDTRIHMAASNFTWFNSALNPIIYVILNPRFRREYLRLIKLSFGITKGRFVHESSVTSAKQKANNNQKKNSLSSSNHCNPQIRTVSRQGSKDNIINSSDP